MIDGFVRTELFIVLLARAFHIIVMALAFIVFLFGNYCCRGWMPVCSITRVQFHGAS